MSCSWPSPSVRLNRRASAGRAPGPARASPTAPAPARPHAPGRQVRVHPPVPVRRRIPRMTSSRSARACPAFSRSPIPALSATRRSPSGTPPSTCTFSRSTARTVHDFRQAAYSASMNSNLSVTDGRGRSMLRLFSGTQAPSSVPGFPARARATARAHSRSAAVPRGMLTAVDINPVTKGAFVNTELLRHSSDRARRLDHHLHGFILEFR